MSEALNVTKAAFGGLREVTTAPLWQYDYGQILQIDGLDLPQAFEVHFSNSRKSGETITQIGTGNQVVIPDMYLTSGEDIYAFVFLHDGLTDGETEYVIKIPVRERPEPSDIEPTPEQQDAITEAIAALNNAANKANVAITHYPQIIEGVWHVWDVTTEAYVSTGVEAQGDGGLSIFFDCASKPIPTDANRKIVENQTLTFGVYAFKGGELIDPENVTASAFTFQSGQYSGAINAVVTHITSDRPQWHVSYTLRTSANITLRADSGTQTVNVTVDGVVHKIYFPWSAAKQGIQGEGGLSILLTRQAIVLPTDNNRVPQSALTASVEVTAVKGTKIVGIDDVSGSSVNMEYTDGQGVRHGTFVMPTIEVTYDDIRDINVKYKLTYEFETSPYYFMADSGNITLTIVIDGVTYKRTIPWTLSKQGIQGEPGDTGATPDLTIGTVETLPAGSQATASITGTEEEPVLNLGLPKGDAGDVSDVQINGASIVNAQGVANIPYPVNDVGKAGVVKITTAYGLSVNSSTGNLSVNKPTGGQVKAGNSNGGFIAPLQQHEAVFWGLSKVAGYDLKDVTATLGTYPEASKSAIHDMLNAPVEVTGTTPTIVAKSGIQYICGEVATLDITLPDSGIVDVVFTSGSTPTVLTVTPPTGQTVRWANGFDATSLEADTTYEVNFLNGLGAVMAWT